VELLLFMAIPVVLAETVAISELYLLFSRSYAGRVRSVNRAASIAGGLTSGWYSPTSYSMPWCPSAAPANGAARVVPLLGLALLDLKLVARGATEERRIKLHAVWVGVFLVVAHVAMIFGMMDPKILGANAVGHGEDSHLMPVR